MARVEVMLGGRHGRELRVARVGGARRRVHDARVLRLLLAEVLLLHHGDVGGAVHLQSVSFSGPSSRLMGQNIWRS